MAPELDNELNDQVEEVIDDATVITVPIDDTLTNSGEAADAKAVGDALAMKADKSELQTAVTVNGQSADAQGAILVDASEIKMSSSDQTTVKAKIEAVDGKTGADIPVDNSQGAQTIKQALQSGATRTADQIEMSSTDNTTVKAKIESVEGDVNDLQEAVNTLGEKTAADIKYNTGSNETIKEHVDAIDQGLVKSVNEQMPDSSGNIDLERVPLADNLYTEDAQQVDASFLIRTTAGAGSVSDGNAWAQKLLGNSSHAGYVAESIDLTVNAMPRTTPAAITASIDQATFKTAAGEAGTYVFNYTTEWDVSPTSYGITVSNTPVNGDKITVVWDGTNDATMTVDAVTRTAPAAITATIDRDIWVSEVNASGTYTFTYTTAWSADLTDYGITVTNDPIAGDQIVVVYVKEVRGTITVATPTKLVGTGWNLYDHSKGYARVVKYSNLYGYAISGTYTSIAFAETPTGTTTAITPDEDGLFTVSKDGYVIVTGGNGTDTAIWTTWSDWDEGYDGNWEAYSESSVDISTIMSSRFPYGLLKVGSGSSAVYDEIDFVHKQAISRVSRVAYSDEARAAAESAGRVYEFDENYIYQARASEIVNSITIDEEYTVSEHGLEYFASSTIPVYSEILYGQNLKDKLKRNVVTLSEQTLTGGQKGQVRANIGAAAASELTSLENGLAIVVEGNKTAYASGAAIGDYVFVKNSTIADIVDGCYTAAKAIPYNTVVDKTYFTACPKGLGGEVAALSDQIVQIVSANAPSHNSIYRGKYLGSAVTSAQWTAIKNGTFDDLFVGDYWTIGGVNWRIAGFNYWYNTGDTNCTKNHAVIVPDSNLASCAMNSTNITTGAYVGSDFYTGSIICNNSIFITINIIY